MQLDNISDLIQKALKGDTSKYKLLAEAFYYGNIVERSIPLARYWAFKAIAAGDKSASSIYDIANNIHLTGDEKYIDVSGKYGLAPTSFSWFFSQRLRGSHDRCPERNNYYRSYYCFRLGPIVVPVGAYRVLAYNNGYRILGEEKMRPGEFVVYLFFDIISIIILCILFAS